jgi:hypothetical protein
MLFWRWNCWFLTIFHPSITFIRRQITKELRITCKCTFMTLRVLIGKESMHNWQGCDLSICFASNFLQKTNLNKTFIDSCLFWITWLFRFDNFVNAILSFVKLITLVMIYLNVRGFHPETMCLFNDISKLKFPRPE